MRTHFVQSAGENFDRKSNALSQPLTFINFNFLVIEKIIVDPVSVFKISSSGERFDILFQALQVLCLDLLTADFSQRLLQYSV